MEDEYVRTTVYLHKPHLVAWKALGLPSKSEFFREQMAERLNDEEFLTKLKLRKEIGITETRISMLKRKMRQFEQQESDLYAEAHRRWEINKVQCERLGYKKEDYIESVVNRLRAEQDE